MSEVDRGNGGGEEGAGPEGGAEGAAPPAVDSAPVAVGSAPVSLDGPLGGPGPAGGATLPGRPERRRAPRPPAPKFECSLCGKSVARHAVVRKESIRPEVAGHIVRLRGEAWCTTGFICQRCLETKRTAYMLFRLREERGALSAVEADVARKAGSHALVAEDIDREFEAKITRGGRIADAVARVGGSWTFLISFGGFLLVWMAVNAFLLRAHAFDPFPFILLNLCLSTLAAVQAPIIMMSQNRLAARDRMQADQDFRVNLKAEIEVASLHEKIDHLLHAQWERMVEMQQVQIELLQELAGRRKAPPA